MGAQAVRLSNVDIDNALKNKDFEVLFQPIFDLGNGALARMESFVRWRHPNLGLLPPGAFISFFESQGRMSELTRYVLDNAISAYTNWRGPFAPGLSINLALSDLSDEAFASHFLKLLRDHEFPADLVTLECPMPPVDMSPEKASEHFKRLSDTGARLAIEVRGRANDLLRSLDPFPFDEIKTGGSAILRFARTVRGPGLSAIADLLDVANNANAAITAVGVEDQASLAALRGLGFTAAQGNHLGKVGELKDFRPHRINEVRELLELEPLSSENIAALFRTEAPSLSTTDSAPKETAKDAPSETEDALLERLNERVAQFGADDDDVAAEISDEAEAAPDTPEQDEAELQKKAKAREKAKALMLAKRAKAREDRKAAAIERAKARAAGKSAPRELQERLSEAFKPATKPAQEQSDAPGASAGSEENKAAPETAALPQKIPSTSSQAEVPEQARPAEPDQARAASAAAAQASQPSAVFGGISGGVAQPLRLSVGAASAYFQPGIRVGAPALSGAPKKPIKPAALNIPAQDEAEGETPSLAADAETPDDDSNGEKKPRNARPSTVERAMASLAPQDAPFKKGHAHEIPATPPQKARHAPQEIIGDLHEEEEEDEAPEAAPKQRKRKSFLKRTVIPYPTHFWPKSWKRAWRRRMAAKAARLKEDAQSNDKIAAE